MNDYSKEGLLIKKLCCREFPSQVGLDLEES